MEVVDDSLPRRREEVPRRWQKASPLRCREEQDDVNQTSQQPATDGPEVPMTT